jgi:hypothetical protein
MLETMTKNAVVRFGSSHSTNFYKSQYLIEIALVSYQ